MKGHVFRQAAALACLLLWVSSLQAQSVGSGSTVEDPDAAPLSASDPEKTGGRKQAEEGVLPLQEYSVTVEEKAVKVAGLVHLRRSQELQTRQLVRTLPESLSKVPGVMVQKTSHGQGSPYFRGFTGFRTLFLIDGIRLNNSVFRDGPNQYWNTVDPFTVAQSEIIKGPSSVLFGSDAVGGTMNVLTQSVEEFGDGFDWGGRLFQRASTAENAYVGRLELRGNVGQRFAFLAGGNVKEFGDLRGGSQVGRQPKTGYSELDGDLKLEFYTRSGSRVVVAHQRVDQDDAWRTHRTVFGIPWEGTTVGDEKQRILDQNRHLSYIQYHSSYYDFPVNRAKLSLSHQVQSEERFRLRSNDRTDLQGFDVGTTGLWARLESDTRLGYWTYGAEYYHDSVNSFRRDFNADGSLRSVSIQGPVADDASYDSLGLYAENRIPATDRLDILLGLRYSYSSAEAKRVEDPQTGKPFSLSDSWSKGVGSARFMYHLQPDERLNLFGGISQGFRAPNLSDLTRLDTARSNEIEVPSPGLDPEKFVAYEVGAKAERETWRAQLAFFYTDIDRLIVRTPTGEMLENNFEIIKKNAGDGFVRGVELEAVFKLRPGLTASTAFAAMTGEADTFPTSQPLLVQEPLDRLFPATGLLRLEWENPRGNLWLGAEAKMSQNQDRLSTRDRSDTQRIPPRGTPGYAVFSLWAGWRINPRVTASAMLENIGDRDYRIHGSGLNEAGRNLIVGLDLGF